jgi:hypothetical protein
MVVVGKVVFSLMQIYQHGDGLSPLTFIGMLACSHT